jgi:hypothetical protein
MSMKTRNDSGIALITTLLILVLLAALVEAFILSINSEQEQIGIDRGQNRAFYGAMTGLEQLTAGLGDLMAVNASPTDAQLQALASNPPALTNISYTTGTGQLPGFEITRGTQSNGIIPSGIYSGLYGMIVPYRLAATAHTTVGKQEARMVRDLQVILIPVFQFGVFSENALNIFPGSTFDFGGRIHTNSDLYISCSGGTLFLRQKVTAFGQISRTKWANNASSSTGGVVSVAAPGGPEGDPRNLATTEDSAASNWKTVISPIKYNHNIMDGATGAKRMELPITNGTITGPIDIIKRPKAGEEDELLDQRHFELASMRILLSDSPSEITNLPYIDTSTQPIHLIDTVAGQAFAKSNRTADGDFKTVDGANLIEGYIKIEIKTARHTWQDVTQTILNKKYTGPNMGGGACANPSPDAIIRIQRLKDNTSGCGSAANAKDIWPNTLYDVREGALSYSDGSPSGSNVLLQGVVHAPSDVYLGGVMHYIELDIANLCTYLRSSGAMKPNEGYHVYFSDRRLNKNSSNLETGEYGNDSILDYYTETKGSYLTSDQRKNAGDVNGNGAYDNYGRNRITYDLATTPLNAAAPLNTATPETIVTAPVARKNRAIFFRRALKLVNGKTLSLGMNGSIPYGLSITSENPVYIQGDYNAPNGTPTATTSAFATGSSSRVAAAVMADAVTLLSNSWNDKYSFDYAHATEGQGRNASHTSYGIAIIAGTNKNFPLPSYPSVSANFGTDGGLHNFLRYLENWRTSSGTQQTLWYEGSLVSLYYSRQGIGIFKNGGNNPVYFQPVRRYNFNADYTQPDKLPPNTPKFRDINITGFTQMKLPD